MNDSLPGQPRPPAITGICVIGLINASQMLFMVLSPQAKQFGSIYPLYFSAAIVVSLVCIAGLWLLRRWAAATYALLLLCNQLVLLGMGLWETSAAIIPVVIALLLFKHWDKMS